MQKLRTHSGSKKRTKVTKTGKLLTRKSFGNHFLAKKDQSRKRTYAGLSPLSGKIKSNVKKRIGA
jgi:ribosomal protein L35